MQHPYGWISGIMWRREASCGEARHHVETRGIMWRRETSRLYGGYLKMN